MVLEGKCVHLLFTLSPTPNKMCFHTSAPASQCDSALSSSPPLGQITLPSWITLSHLPIPCKKKQNKKKTPITLFCSVLLCTPSFHLILPLRPLFCMSLPPFLLFQNKSPLSQHNSLGWARPTGLLSWPPPNTRLLVSPNNPSHHSAKGPWKERRGDSGGFKPIASLYARVTA